jgi:hypothetical protein
MFRTLTVRADPSGAILSTMTLSERGESSLSFALLVIQLVSDEIVERSKIARLMCAMRRSAERRSNDRRLEKSRNIDKRSLCPQLLRRARRDALPHEKLRPGVPLADLPLLFA